MSELENLKNDINYLVAMIMAPTTSEERRVQLGAEYEILLAKLRKLKPDLTCDFFR